MDLTTRPHLRVVRDAEIPLWAHLTVTTLENLEVADEAEYMKRFAQEGVETRQMGFLVWHNGRAIGRLRLRVSGDQAAAWGLGLAPEALAEGLESALVEAIEDQARNAGAGHLYAEVTPSLTTLFSGAGYRPKKSRVGMRAKLVHRPVVCGRTMRHPRPGDEADVQAIGQLYYDAYLNTIDHDGETLDEALAEAKRTLGDQYGHFLADCSFVLEGTDGPAAATLVTEESDDTALLAEVMICPGYRGQGYARPLIQAAMNACLERGFTDMVLMVTLGNVPAEGLYRRMGFVEEPGFEVDHLEKELYS